MKRHLLLLIAVLNLSACKPADEGLALQDDYLQRLSTALDVPAAEPFNPDSLTRYRLPERRERLLDIPEVRISLLELLVDVRRCPELQQLISQRNSSLGKQLTASSRLAYEGDLLRATEACMAHLRTQDSTELLGQLIQQLLQAGRWVIRGRIHWPQLCVTSFRAITLNAWCWGWTV